MLDQRRARSHLMPWWVGAVGAIGLFVAALGVSGPLLAQEDGFPLDTWLLRESDLGSRRAGTLCLPEGTLHWKHVSAPDEAANRLLVERIVSTAFEQKVLTGLGAELLAMNVRSCAKGYALGKRNILSGNGTVSVRWSIDGDRERAVIIESQFTFKAASAGSGEILGAAMRAAVADLIRRKPELAPAK